MIKKNINVGMNRKRCKS